MRDWLCADRVIPNPLHGLYIDLAPESAQQTLGLSQRKHLPISHWPAQPVYHRHYA